MRDNRRAIFRSLVAAAAGLYVLMCAFLPIGIGADLHHDDALFIANARFFASGQWFGPYNQFTLAKGPGYPIFLAISSWTGLPFTINQALFNCLAVGALAYVIQRLSGSRLLALATFLIVLWNPGTFCFKVLRQGIYPAQVLLFIAAYSYVLFCEVRIRRVVLGSLATGLILGWLWLTREEGIWLLPGTAVLATGAVLRSWLRDRSFRLPAIATAGVTISFALLLLGFRVGNLIAYGSMVGVDTKEPNFVGALSALQRVQLGKPTQFVPVTARARRQIYQVSPAFASLQNYLDPPGSTLWEAIACQKYSWACGEISGASFQWALRDAVAETGNYRSPARAAGFFHRLGAEVRSACRRGELVCDSSWIPFLPRLGVEQIQRLPAAFGKELTLLLFVQPPPLVESPSTGTPADLAEDLRLLNFPFHRCLRGAVSERPEFEAFSTQQRSWLGKPLSSVARITSQSSCDGYLDAASFDAGSRDDYRPATVAGWAWDPKTKRALGQIVLTDGAGKVVGFASGGIDRPDVLKVRPGSLDRNLGWQGYADEARSVAAYALLNDGREACRLGGVLNIEAPASANDTDPRVQWARGFRTNLVGAYRFIMPVLFAAGLLAMLMTVVTQSGQLVSGDWPVPDPMLLLAAAAWTMLFSDLMVLALVHVSWFEVINYSYLAPAYPLACLAPMLSIWSAIHKMGFSRASNVGGAAVVGEWAAGGGPQQ